MESIAENSKTTENSNMPIDEFPSNESNPLADSEKTNDVVEDSKVTKPKSNFWTYFTKLELGIKAKCIHCSTSISCRTKAGPTTSAMLNHLKKCRKLSTNSEVDDDEIEGKMLKQATLFHRPKKNRETSSFLTFGQSTAHIALNDDESIRLMARNMKRKFDKYWGNFDNVNLMIFIATMLDPRHKLEWVSWMIGEVYDADDATCLVSMIKTGLEKLFRYYESFASNTSKTSNQVQENVPELPTTKTDNCALNVLMKSMFKQHRKDQKRDVTKLELEQYLSDEIVDSDEPKFHILNWWKVMSSKYKILALMARDVLAMPVSTVVSESAFSAGGRVLDVFRSSLSPPMVEALICTQDWLRRDDEPIEIEDKLDKVEKLESDMF